MRLRSIGAFLGAVMLMGLAGGVAHAQYPPATDEECVLTFDGDGAPQSTFSAGELINVAGQAADPENSPCFDAGSIVQIFFVQSTQQIAQTSADAQGNYGASGRIPSDARPGAAAVEARGTLNGDAVIYSRAITIREPAPVRPVLPVTGGDIAVLAMWGVGFVALGTTLVSVTRRRRRRSL